MAPATPPAIAAVVSVSFPRATARRTQASKLEVSKTAARADHSESTGFTPDFTDTYEKADAAD